MFTGKRDFSKNNYVLLDLSVRDKLCNLCKFSEKQEQISSSFSCAQHGLHDVVVGFRRSLWLSGIITLLNFTFKKLVRNCLDSLEGNLLCPRPWGRYVVLYGYKETKIYT